jgi:hypothetical protein
MNKKRGTKILFIPQPRREKYKNKFSQQKVIINNEPPPKKSKNAQPSIQSAAIRSQKRLPSHESRQK